MSDESFNQVIEKYSNEKPGFIGTDHLESLLKDLGYSPTSKLIEEALDALDPDANGFFDKFSFLKWFEDYADILNETDSRMEGQILTKDGKSGKAKLGKINSNMLEAKNERKRAQADVQLLANRLAHLRAEEEKARKRIQETERRAQQIQVAKERTRKRKEESKKQGNEVKKSLATASIEKSQCSDKLRSRKEEVMQKSWEEKRRQVHECKTQKNAMKEKIAKDREETLQSLMKKKEKIRKEQEMAAKKRLIERKKREQEQIRRAQEQLAEEYRQKIVSEQLIKDMEKEEAKLIASLKATQERQRAAYRNLENVL